MKIIRSKAKLKKIIKSEKKLGFVPTMGAIHLGHLSLIRKSISECNKTLVSIYVNKPQFNKTSDFSKYPRFLKKDIKIIRKTKADYLYLPTDKQIYENNKNINLKISNFSRKLCGKFRPRHFKAVVDVINRFIKIIKPQNIYLGEKDMQQLVIVNNFVKKNYPNIKVVGCKTIREKSGIAFSSRNYLLSNKEKLIASNIFKNLKRNKTKIIKNKQLALIKKKVLKLGATSIDYVEVLNVNKFIKLKKNRYKNKIFIAYYLGETRLIDNI